MPSFRRLFSGVVRKRLLLLRRYPVNTGSELLGLYVFFAIVVFGGYAVAAPTITDTLPGIIVGFFLFSMAYVAYSGLSWDVMHEAQWGTLEQLVVSPYGLGRVMAAKVAADLLVSVLYGGVLLSMMLVTTGKEMSIDLLTVVPLVILSLLSVVGVGFSFAGLALLYKRIENVLLLAEFALVPLVAAPVDAVPALKLLPLVEGTYLLRRAMTHGIRLWEFPPADLGLLLLTTVSYLALGYLVLRACVRRARRDGLFGQY
jgi:ABC-2 type transport system permease protein